MRPSAHRTVLHVDIDAFFASVEQARNPRLRGRPVVVGGREFDRGVVACASYEARALGVKTAMPLRQAYSICPQAVFLKGNFSEYQKCSDAIVEILFQYSPLVEILSIDEANVELTGTERIYDIPRPRRFVRNGRPAPDSVSWAYDVAAQIRSEAKAATGLNVSAGVGTSPLVAKIACSLAKPNGLIQVRPGDEAEFLAPLPVGELAGVGRATEEKLKMLNVNTVADLRQIPRDALAGMFGVHGEALYERCRGRDDTPVRLNGLPKSVGRSTTFGRDTDDMEFVEGMLYYLTERAANYLRSLRMRARCVHARLRYADFSTYACSKRLALSTDCDGEFFAVARFLLRRLHTRRMKVRLVGVGLSELSAAALYQPDLFSWEQYFRKKHLYRAIDGIRDRHGFGALVAGPSIALMNSAPRGARGFFMNNPSLAR